MTINLEPNAQGYENMAKLMLQSILSDVPVSRKNAVRTQLHGVLDITRYLASNPETYTNVLAILNEVAGGMATCE